MKKIRNNILFVLLNYLLFTGLINLRYFVATFIKHSDKYSLNIFSITAIISTVLISILFIYRKKININKLHFCMVYLLLLVLGFCEAYHVEFIAFPFVCIYVYLMFITYITMYISKQRFEVSIVIGFSIMLLIAFVMGLLGLLILVKYLILISVALAIAYLTHENKKNKNKLVSTLNEFFNSGFIIFCIMYMIIVLGGSGMFVNWYDEYSHWAFDAKSMIYYSQFGTSQKIMLKTKGYAPIFTVWHYIVSIFNGFSECNLFIGLNILTSIFLMPAFTFFEKKKVYIRVMAFIAIFFCCYIFGGVYIYSSLYVDLAISVIFSALLIFYFRLRNDKNSFLLPITLLIIIITLSKTNGFVISFVYVVIILVNEFLLKFKNNKTTIKNIINLSKELFKKYYKFILSIVITFMIWKIYLIITGKITHEYYDSVIMPDILKGNLTLKLNASFVRQYIKSILSSFDSTLIYGNINISVYQFIVLLFLSLYICFKKKTKDCEKSVKLIISFVIGYTLFFSLTVVAMFYALSLYEASQLASFGRYLNWFNVGALIFLLSYVFDLDLEKRDKKFNLFYIILILIIPFSNLVYFIYNPLNAGSYGIYEKYNEKVKVIKENVPAESMVYIIDQKDEEGIMAMWHVRYYAFPIQTNASSASISWKIKTKNNKDDLKDWGLTRKKWEKELIKYKFEYVYLFSSDNEFYKETKNMYTDYSEAKKSTLFKVIIKNNSVKLEPIE